MIVGVKQFYVRVNSNFDFFVNVKSCFEFPVMREKAKYFCVTSVIRKGIYGDPNCVTSQCEQGLQTNVRKLPPKTETGARASVGVCYFFTGKQNFHYYQFLSLLQKRCVVTTKTRAALWQ